MKKEKSTSKSIKFHPNAEKSKAIQELINYAFVLTTSDVPPSRALFDSITQRLGIRYIQMGSGIKL